MPMLTRATRREIMGFIESHASDDQLAFLDKKLDDLFSVAHCWLSYSYAMSQGLLSEWRLPLGHQLFQPVFEGHFSAQISAFVAKAKRFLKKVLDDSISIR